MRKIYFIALLMFVICGCNKKINEKTDGIQTIVVDFAKLPNSEDVGKKFFSSCKYVQLETNENCMIAEITKIIVQKDRIFVLDYYKSASVFIFDETGKWINTINRKGQGPEEYLDILDMFLDKENKLCILSRSGKKIMTFSKDGDLESQKKLPAYFMNMESMGDGYIADAKNTPFTPSFDCNIVIFSSEMDVLKQAFPASPEWDSNSLRAESSFSKYKNDIYYYPSMDYNVYRITKDSIVHAYRYDFGKRTFPDELKNPDSFFNSDVWERQKYIVELNLFKETEKYAICSVLFDGQFKLTFFSKEDKSTQSFMLFESPFCAVMHFGHLKAITDDYVITSNNADRIHRVLNDSDIIKDNPKSVKWLKETLPRPVKEEDNPILCFYQFK